jgi:hypothetical protein
MVTVAPARLSSALNAAWIGGVELVADQNVRNTPSAVYFLGFRAT